MKLLTWLIVPLVVMTYGSNSVRAQSQARTVQLTIDQTPESSFPGSPCLIRVSSTAQLKKLRGRLLGKEIYFNQETGGRSWFGLAGISLNSKPGQSYAVEVEGETESGKPVIARKDFRVGQSKALMISEPFVTPDQDSQVREQIEKDLKFKVLGIVSPQMLWRGVFGAPLDESVVTSGFGLLREYRGGRRSVHLGVDYRADLGTSVKAINGGKVILARELFREGNIVVIDHGQGLLSLYFHLSAFRVSEGETVASGQIIALSGQSGQSTGPHLHMGVRWQGLYLNPEILMSLNNLPIISPSKELSGNPPVAPSPANGDSYALVIGVSDYNTPWPKLPGVKMEAPAVKDALEELGFNVKLVMDPDRNALRQSLADFIRDRGQSQSNRLIIYFSGHGYTLKLQRGEMLGYLAPKDAPSPGPNPGDFKSASISIGQIEDFSEQAEAGDILFVFNSCFSGILSERKGRPINHSVKHFVRRYITAGAATQKVYDNKSFYEAFVNGVRGEADLNKDGLVKSAELGEFIQRQVDKSSGGTQTPVFGSFKPLAKKDKDDDFSLTPKGGQLIQKTFEFKTLKNGRDQSLVVSGLVERLGVDKQRNAIEIELVKVPGTAPKHKFSMGDAGGAISKVPAHKVSLRPFFLSRFEITQEQWRYVSRLPMLERELKEAPSSLKGNKLPVQNVSWEDAVEFCKRLSVKTGRDYRLPTEAEWEYAARATEKFGLGNEIEGRIARFDTDKPVAVGNVGYANPLGLFDMHGNVWEWCQDVWHDNYEGAPRNGDAWIVGGNQRQRVSRGGSWGSHAEDCRSSHRASQEAVYRGNDTGFRVAVYINRR